MFSKLFRLAQTAVVGFVASAAILAVPANPLALVVVVGCVVAVAVIWA